MIANEGTENSDAFVEAKHRKTLHISCRPSVHALTGQIYKLFCVRKTHPFTSYPVAKNQKHRKFAITGMREKPLYDTGVNFSSRNNFTNLGSFAKVSVPVETIIPCLPVGSSTSSSLQFILAELPTKPESQDNRSIINILTQHKYMKCLSKCR